MMRVDLPSPLAPGKNFVFSLDWSYKINNSKRISGRTGAEYFPKDGNWLYEIAQWFPRMAAYTDVNGWQHKQFLGTGEFTLEPNPAGGTRFTWTERLVFPWWLGGPLGALVGGQIVMKAIWRPSGEKDGAVSIAGSVVSRVTWRERRSITKISELPLFSSVSATRLPSGEKRGESWVAVPEVRARGSPPAKSPRNTSQSVGVTARMNA